MEELAVVLRWPASPQVRPVVMVWWYAAPWLTATMTAMGLGFLRGYQCLFGRSRYRIGNLKAFSANWTPAILVVLITLLGLQRKLLSDSPLKIQQTPKLIFRERERETANIPVKSPDLSCRYFSDTPFHLGSLRNLQYVYATHHVQLRS
ncbi:hypothetical protein Hdeb2414_s0010g00341361 [Helianthus debilis subsp. tardiflorus]